MSQDIERGRGATIELDTRDVTRELEELEGPRAPPTIALRIDRLGAEISSWLGLILDLKTLPDDLKAEQKQYFRALFNLSIDKRTRLVMVQNHDVLRIMTRFLRKMRQDDSLSTLMAAVANFVYEDESKDRLMQEQDVPALFTRLLGSTNNAVATHTARGIFSLTTIYEFKKRFASEDGLLAALIGCLRRDSGQLIMNAAGAIANIAIHPESKVPIVSLGALDPLMGLGRDEDEEGVLHQVSRCLFSLAAERSNRPLMCSKGIMSIISRLLGFTQHVEILTNAIGCFGNLAMSEPEASEESIGTALRLLPLLAASSSPAMDRQATRVLLAFVSKDTVRSTMATHNHLTMLVAKLESTDMTVVRDVLGIISSLVFGDADLKERVCELGGLRRVLALFVAQPEYINGEALPEALPPLVRVLFAIASCPTAREAICAEKNGCVLKALCSLTSKLVQAEDVHAWTVGAILKHALGTLACLACEERHSAILAEHGAIRLANEALYMSTRQDIRRQAGRLLYNLVRRHGIALTYMTRWGGRNGEALRLEADLKELFRESFELCPVSAQNSNDASLVRVPVLVQGQSNPVMHVVKCPYTILRARAPLLMSPDRCGELPAVSRDVWATFFELICTNSISQVSDLVSYQLYGQQWLTLTRFIAANGTGPERELAQVQPSGCAAAMPLSTCPLDLDQPMFGASASGLGGHHGAGHAISATVQLLPVVRGSGSGPLTMDSEEEVREPDSLGLGANSDLRSAWTECMTNVLLTERQRPSHLPRILPGELLLKSCATDTMALVRLSDETDSPKPRRARQQQRSPLRKKRGTAQPEAFFEDLLAEWSVPAEEIAAGRKRKRAPRPLDEEGAGEVYIRADRSMLAARSRYFRSLLTGPFAESMGAENEFDFRASPLALVAIVRYIHCGMDAKLTDALERQPQMCWEVFSAAHEYGLEGLQYACERIIALSAQAHVAKDASLDTVLDLARAVHGLNAPFIKLCLGHLAYTNQVTKHGEICLQLLDLVGMPHLQPRPPQLNVQRGDSGGIEHSELDPELSAAARKLSVMGQHRA